MTSAIINLIIIIPFIIFAIALSKGKGASLLAGYNTMSAEKKAQYDEMAVCKFMSKIMYALSCSIFLWALSDLLDVQVLFVIGFILFMGILIFALVYLNTGNRFKKSEL